MTKAQDDAAIRMKKKSLAFPTESSSKISHLKSNINPNYSLPLDQTAPIFISQQRITFIQQEERGSVWTTPTPYHSPPSAPRDLALTYRCVGVLEGLEKGREMFWGNTET